MALYEPAWQFMMQHEDSQLSGIVTPEPDGAKARLGINSKAHPEAVESGFFEMPLEQAIPYASDLYKYTFFHPIGGYNIAAQAIANKFFDMAVNMGVHEATVLMQRAVNKLLKSPIALDGNCGPATMNAINRCDPDVLLDALKDQAHNFYLNLVSRKPELEKYLPAWLARADA